MTALVPGMTVDVKMLYCRATKKDRRDIFATRSRIHEVMVKVRIPLGEKFLPDAFGIQVRRRANALSRVRSDRRHSFFLSPRSSSSMR